MQQAQEYEIKAKILRALGSYVLWPAPVAAEVPSRPFVIGVLGHSPFGSYLDEACRGKLIQARKISILYTNDSHSPELSTCDLLFICASESAHLSKSLLAFSGRPVLTIGDTPGFARRGIMLNMLVVSGTVGLEVNLKATRAAGLEINSAFLSLSKDKTQFVETE